MTTIKKDLELVERAMIPFESDGAGAGTNHYEAFDRIRECVLGSSKDSSGNGKDLTSMGRDLLIKEIRRLRRTK